MLDTAAAVRELENAGADHRLAEAIVATIGRSHEGLATTADLDHLDTKFAARIADLRADLLTAVGETKIEIANVRWQAILAALAIAGVLFAALKLF